jgi:peptidyl-prolyl cis-trans isomerase NIMA-interacting 1
MAAPAEPPAHEVVGAAQILVAYKGATAAPPSVTRSRADAKKRAEEALQKIRDQKENFEQLVAAYSDDPVSRASAGAVGNFERNVMHRAFSDAAFALPVGGISGVVETPSGFHIIRRLR